MELAQIEHLIEKYFEAETSIADEKQLQLYFSSPNVAQHLKQYRSVFGYYKQAKQEKFVATIHLPTHKKRTVWIRIAASILILFGVGFFVVINKQQQNSVADLGTYNSPEEAFKETQKALALLSTHVNVGIESVHYVYEYQKTKERVFN